MGKTLKDRGHKWLLLALVFTSLGASAESFLCVTDQTTGFNKYGDEWKSSTLSNNFKYILKYEDEKWLWTEIGNGLKDFCEAKKRREIFSCQTTKGHLVFNGKLLRFVFSYPGGYALEQFGNDSVSIEIGRCSPL